MKKFETVGLVSEQFGFWKSVSTDNALYELTESILSVSNRRECVAGIVFDLTKVFHCINHKLLIHKLQYYGIRGVTLDCFRSYLFDRKQRVKMKLISTLEDCCNWRIIKHRVPQGPVSGTLSFNMLHKQFWWTDQQLFFILCSLVCLSIHWDTCIIGHINCSVQFIYL